MWGDPPDLSASHTVLVRVEVWADGQLLHEDAPVTDGVVTDTRVTAGIRRHLQLTVPPTPFWRSAAARTLEVRPWRGVARGRAPQWWAPLGRFQVWPSTRSIDPRRPITIAGDDMWCRVVGDDFLRPQDSYPGLIRDNIRQLLDETSPRFPVEVSASSYARLDPVLWDGTRHDAIAGMVLSIGAEAWVNRIGRFVVQDRNLATTPVTEVRTGAGGTVVALDEQVDWAQVFNAVAVTSSAAGVVLPAAIAAVTDTQHPAHQWRIGRRVKRWASPLITTADQATAAAAALLDQVSGPARSLRIQQVPNPALDAGDVITVAWAGGSELARIQSVTHPLAPSGVQQITTVSTREET